MAEDRVVAEWASRTGRYRAFLNHGEGGYDYGVTDHDLICSGGWLGGDVTTDEEAVQYLDERWKVWGYKTMKRV